MAVWYDDFMAASAPEKPLFMMTAWSTTWPADSSVASAISLPAVPMFSISPRMIGAASEPKAREISMMPAPRSLNSSSSPRKSPRPFMNLSSPIEMSSSFNASIASSGSFSRSPSLIMNCRRPVSARSGCMLIALSMAKAAIISSTS